MLKYINDARSHEHKKKTETFCFPCGLMGQTVSGTYPDYYSMGIRDPLHDISRFSPYINFYFLTRVRPVFISNPINF